MQFGCQLIQPGAIVSLSAMQTQLEEIIAAFGADTGSFHLLEDGVLILKGTGWIASAHGGNRREGACRGGGDGGRPCLRA